MIKLAITRTLEASRSRIDSPMPCIAPLPVWLDFQGLGRFGLRGTRCFSKFASDAWRVVHLTCSFTDTIGRKSKYCISFMRVATLMPYWAAEKTHRIERQKLDAALAVHCLSCDILPIRHSPFPIHY